MGTRTAITRRSSTGTWWGRSGVAAPWCFRLQLLFLVWLVGTTRSMAQETMEQTTTTSVLVFAVVPKTIDNDFFLPVQKGCHDEARRISNRNLNVSVICEVWGPHSTNYDIAQSQYDILLRLLLNESIAGIAISVQDAALLTPLFQQNAKKKPVVTFDSDIITGDDHNSIEQRSVLRNAFVGTNNTYMGKEIARMIIQLHPQVGTYGILSSKSAPNIQQRLHGFVSELDDRKQGWRPVAGSPGDTEENVTTALDVLDALAVQNPTCIVSLMGLPMRVVTNPTDQTSTIPWQAFYERHQHRNISFFSIDAMPHQLELLASGYVRGLVGQLPYEMGTGSIATLYDIVMGNGLVEKEGTDDPTFLETNILSHTFLPIDIPEKEVDPNLLGDLSYLGYTLFGVILLTAFALMHWTINYRNVRVVQVAQPKFLGMIIIGVVILATCLVPLGMDDGGDPDNLNSQQAIWICMGSPWLVSIGFTITFSALYAKTHRINKIFHSDSAFARVKVSESEFLVPFLILLICNIIVLTCWTIVDPLTYQRRLVLGEDGWNRVLSTYGVCRSDSADIFFISMAILNLGVLIAANWQAFEARHLEAEFAETKYIGICMASMLQAIICGVPVLFVVRHNPKAYYMVLVFMVFIISMTLLLVIFLPKIMFAQIFLSKSEREQRDFISFIIQQSSRQRKKLKKDAYQGQPQFGIPESPGLAVSPTVFNRWTTPPQTREPTNPSNSSRWQSVPQHFTPASRSNEKGEASATTGIECSSNVMPQISEEPSGPIDNTNSNASFLLNTGQSVSSAITAGSSFMIHSGTSVRGDVWGTDSHLTQLDPSDDDGEDGMLVYRTVSVCADGTIRQTSLHSLHQLSARSLAPTTDSSRQSRQSPRQRDKMEHKSSWKSFFSSSNGGSSASLNSHVAGGRSVDDGPVTLRPVRKTISNGKAQKARLTSTVLRAINEKDVEGSDSGGSQLSSEVDQRVEHLSTATSSNQVSVEVEMDATVESATVLDTNDDDDGDDAIFSSAHMEEEDRLAESIGTPRNIRRDS